MNRERSNEYTKALEGLHFSEEVKSGMARKLIENMEEAERGGRPVKLKRFIPKAAVIGIAAALALSVGAGAAVVCHRLASESFAGVFGTSHTEIIDKIGRPVGAADTDNGVTITADAIIGDKYHYAITYSISKDDGTPFDIDLSQTFGAGLLSMGFEYDDVSLSGWRGGAHGGSYFYDADPSDNSIQYVLTREVSDGEVTHRKAKAKFENLYKFDGDYNKIIVAEGTWKINFDLDFEDASIDLPSGQTFEQGGMNFTVDSVSLSPIALRVDYTVDSMVKWDENAVSGKQSEHDAKQSRLYLENLEIKLVKKDGTVIDMTNSGGSVQPRDGKTVCQKGKMFKEVVPLEDVASVTVGGVEIPVSLS